MSNRKKRELSGSEPREDRNNDAGELTVVLSEAHQTNLDALPDDQAVAGSHLSVVDEQTRGAAGLMNAHVHQLRAGQNRTGVVTPPRPRQTDRLEARRAHRPFLWRLTAFVAVVIAAVALLHAFVIQPVTVTGTAMSPTLQPGNRILMVKAGLLEGSIRSGDIVVLRSPRNLSCRTPGSAGGDLVLRVVATPGQIIASRASTLLVNGRPLAERGWYDRAFGPVGAAPVPATSLGPDQYFVMADDRLDGCDSRAFGPVAKSAIVGKAFAVVSRAGHLSVGGV